MAPRPGSKIVRTPEETAAFAAAISRGKLARSKPVAERFWSKVDVRGPDECWPWQAGTDGEGYGMFHVSSPEGKKSERAHRVAVRLTTGKDLGANIGMHTCDNPPCCNPRHVKRGTKTENNADRDAKGRHRFVRSLGEKHGLSKLTDQIVRDMRASSESNAYFARLYGVSSSVISEARRGVTWGHV